MGFKPEESQLEILKEKKWVYFEDTKIEEVKSFLRETFEAEAESIRTLFIKIDENKSGSLEPIEISRLASSLGAVVTKDEIDKCIAQIDTDGNGTINLEEFTQWWLSGRQGAPDKLQASLSNWAAETQRYGQMAIKQMNDAFKKVPSLEAEDMRLFTVNFGVGNFEEKESGININAKFGILSNNHDPVHSIKTALGFNSIDPFFMIRFHL